MANALTGDFDVVVEIATGAVNRVLAAMHACERFPHSMSVRVDDTPQPGKFPHPAVLGVVDGFGQAIANHEAIGAPAVISGGRATSAALAGLDLVVNAGMIFDPPPVPSLLQGYAQLQLFPPTIDVAGSGTGSITVRQQLMSRYFPDKDTRALAEFIRGELQISSPVKWVVSQHAYVIDINFRADMAGINFTPSSSSTPLTTEDLAGINLVIRNALRTGFLPSSATVPPEIAAVQFKALPGTESAIGLLLNMAPSGGLGNPNSLNSVFLGGSDFAFAAGTDFLHRALRLSKITDHRNSYYDFSIDPTLLLEDGRIVMSFAVHAKGKHWYTPDLSGTVKQAFTLRLIGNPLNTAELALDGDISVEVDNLPDFVADPFKDSLRGIRDEQVAAQQPTIRSMLSIEKNLGSTLRSLLNPSQPGAQPQPDVNFVLAYTSVEITTSGIVLRGSVSVSNWPAAHIEYTQIPAPTGGPNDITFHPPDYSALKTWIPGGTIDRYEWAPNGTNFPVTVENDKFILRDAEVLAPETPGYLPMCLSIGGWRLSSSGPVVKQPFTATTCGYRVFPILGGFKAGSPFRVMVALAQPGPQGKVQIAGHAAALTDLSGKSTPNLIVHFGDEKTSHRLEHIARALRDSGRKDTQTAIVAVLPAEHLAQAQYTPGVVYADNHNQAWEHLFEMKRGPARTLIVAPDGKTLWHQDGDINLKELTAALQKHLVTGAGARHRVLAAGVPPGRLAPNFVIDAATGGATLRKLKGRPAVLVFWRSTSPISIDAVLAWQKGRARSLMLAINDGEAQETARAAARAHGFAEALVTDPQRDIAQAYGVNVWPTLVTLNAAGFVTAIRLGHTAAELPQPESGGKLAR